MQKITPCLWFDNQAEEAAKFYTSIFKKSKIGNISRYGKEGYEIHGREAGTVLTVDFEIEGRRFTGLNGGPVFRFNEAISFVVQCKTQKEVDYYWEKLSEDGDEKAQQCGWLKDKYFVSWQIVPIILGEMLQDRDTEKSERVMKALLQMTKIDIEGLKKTYGDDNGMQFAVKLMSKNSTCVSQHINAPRAKVYRALVEAAAIAKWKVPTGMTCHVHEFDAREGGSIRISLTYNEPSGTGKTTAHTDTYHGRFMKLVPNEQVVEVDEFETADPTLRGEMTVTITLTDADGGTDVLAVHDGLPPGVSTTDNETGWRMALAKLAALVEAA